jgi:hypothetical protein
LYTDADLCLHVCVTVRLRVRDIQQGHESPAPRSCDGHTWCRVNNVRVPRADRYTAQAGARCTLHRDHRRRRARLPLLATPTNHDDTRPLWHADAAWTPCNVPRLLPPTVVVVCVHAAVVSLLAATSAKNVRDRHRAHCPHPGGAGC